MLRGRGWRTAPAATLRLLRHARLACLHGGEAGGAHRLAAVGREPVGKRERGGWGYSWGRVQTERLRPQPQFGGAAPRPGLVPRGCCRCLGTVCLCPAWRRGFGHVGRGTFRPLTALSPCLRAIALVPTQPSRLINGVTFCVGVKMKRGTIYSFTFARD